MICNRPASFLIFSLSILSSFTIFIGDEMLRNLDLQSILPDNEIQITR